MPARCDSPASVDSLGVLRPWIGTSDTSAVSAPVAEQRARRAAARRDSVRTRRCGAHRAAGARASGRGDARARYGGGTAARFARRLAARVGDGDGNVKRTGVKARVSGRDSWRAAARSARSGRPSRRPICGVLSTFRCTHGRGGQRARGGARVRAGRGRMAWTRCKDRRFAGVLRRSAGFARLGSRREGAYAQPASGVHVVELDSLRATFDTLVWRLTNPTSLRLDHGGVAVKSLELRSSSGGRVFASAQVPEEGPIFVNVEADGVRIVTLLQTLQLRHRRGGRLDERAGAGDVREDRRSKGAPACARRASRGGARPTWT